MIGDEASHAIEISPLAQGFSAHLRRWAERDHVNPKAIDVLCESAKGLMQAMARGEVCVQLPPARAAALRASGYFPSATGEHAANPYPLVLDEDNRLYLARYHDFESRLARDVKTLVAEGVPSPGAAAQTWLRRLYPATSTSGLLDRQALATAFALTSRLTVISGGPGTGKTTTVLRVLICLLAEQPQLRIALAAPTGKAAARLAESIAQGLAALPELDPALRDAIPREASTLHRLLGLGYRKASGQRLLHEVVVVDEASMLDLALAARLFRALGPNARLILLGDKDQLAAVEPGAVFSELAAGHGLSAARVEQLAGLLQCSIDRIAAEFTGAPPSGLLDCAVWLTRTYRFAEGSAIAGLAEAIRTRDIEATEAQLRRAVSEDGELLFLPHESETLSRRILDQLATRFASFKDAVALADPTDEASLERLFTAFSQFRVLCALRDGPRGVATLNRELSARLREDAGRRSGRAADWFRGRPVLVTQNDHALGLFNGDIGIALPGSGALEDGQFWEVIFEDSAGGFRSIPAVRLPAHETAFAMTVHKSQGTEFDRVALVLPAASARVLSRELVYTAITRARAQVVLVGTTDRIREALRQTNVRESGLARRLSAPDEEGRWRV